MSDSSGSSCSFAAWSAAGDGHRAVGAGGGQCRGRVQCQCEGQCQCKSQGRARRRACGRKVSGRPAGGEGEGRTFRDDERVALGKGVDVEERVGRVGLDELEAGHLPCARRWRIGRRRDGSVFGVRYWVFGIGYSVYGTQHSGLEIRDCGRARARCSPLMILQKMQVARDLRACGSSEYAVKRQRGKTDSLCGGGCHGRCE